jgi:NADPH-dependent 2,4-dienoyl-CoA reductase/sulfur reductase-like enzyme/nitrite reductase/ring-hydroxylating ferredoxin subunit
MADKTDLTKGVDAGSLADGGLLLGTVAGEDVVLARSGDEFFAVGAECTHYHGPLAEGLVVGDSVRCPWHHACFSLRNGEALRAPALDPVACWRVEREGGRVFVREKQNPEAATLAKHGPTAIVIVGGGAAGLAAADRLRKEGYNGTLTLVSADPSAPYDRPNLSKDYLAGNAPPEWMPLRGDDYYQKSRIDLVLGTQVASIDLAGRAVVLEDGRRLGYERLLLATGAEPVRLPVEGARPEQLFFLRSFADGSALVARSAGAERVVVIGASFIGLEVAASLKQRGLDVHVVAPEALPLERVLGSELGKRVRAIHESHGVAFHLGETVKRVDGPRVSLSGGSTIDGVDFLVLGVGVRPQMALAEQAGLAIDRGVSVNEYLETSAPGVFAAGDIARWPDPHTGEKIRVEHWVVAERQGQAAARNMLGAKRPFDDVPFFWSQHYDVAISYVGHAEKWDAVEIDGDVNADCRVSYKRGGKTLAVATIGRDLESLKAEAALEAAL